MMEFHALIFVLLCFFFLLNTSLSTIATESKDEAVFKFSDLLDDSVFFKLEQMHWRKQHEITPRTFIFRHEGDQCTNLTKEIADVKSKFKDTIIEVQTVKLYTNAFTTYVSYEPVNDDFNKKDSKGIIWIDYKPACTSITREYYANVNKQLRVAIKERRKPDQVCKNYYGMGIEDAWELGYTGKGVIVAVTDVGVNRNLTDLEQNIDPELSYDFLNESKDVTPEKFPSYNELSETDHGNNCAGVIAAVKGNDFCSAGIAFNATIAPLKIFRISETSHGHLRTISNSEAMSRSHVYGKDKIDIFSNSWGPEQMFYNINLDQREALRKSAKMGRGGQGAIHVFPVGQPGNDLVNNEFTIAVSAIGQNGTVPPDHVISSSVITSGLRNGNNIDASKMVTTSSNNKCTSRFAGVSAATAQVAGMIALALDANPQLTLSDVQDILVYSSDLHCLATDPGHNFIVTRNAAGRLFHPVFGFGLLNASKLVKLARKREEGSEFRSIILRQMASVPGSVDISATFCYSCSRNDNSFIIMQECLRKVKTAKIQVAYRTASSRLIMTLTSPSGTESIIQDIQDTNSTKLKTPNRHQILTSVHFWDEKPYGTWRLKILSDGSTGIIGEANLTLFGVMTEVHASSLHEENVRCDSKSASYVSCGTSLLFSPVFFLSIVCFLIKLY